MPLPQLDPSIAESARYSESGTSAQRRRVQQQAAAAAAAAHERGDLGRVNPVDVLNRVRPQYLALRAELAKRTTGNIIYPDGKEPCPAGPYGDDIGAGKTWEGDPNSCLIRSGPWVAPLLERPDIHCNNQKNEMVWLDKMPEIQRLLTRLGQYPPYDATPQQKVDYVEAALGLCQAFFLGLNINPRFCGAASYEGIRQEARASYERCRDRAEAQGASTEEEFWEACGAYGGDIRHSRPLDTLTEWQTLLGGPRYRCSAGKVLMPRMSSAYYKARGAHWWAQRAARAEERLAKLRARGFNERQIEGYLTDPCVQPPFYPNGSLGWAAWTAENSLYQRNVKGALDPFQWGAFAPNSGYAIRNIREFHQHHGTGSSDLQTIRFPMPGAMLDKIEPGARRDKGKAERALRIAMGLPPRHRLLLIARVTNDLPWDGQASGWSFDRIFRFVQGLPEPARTIDEVRPARVFGINYYVHKAAEWAALMARVDPVEIIKDSMGAYLAYIEDIIKRREEQGIPVEGVSTNDVRAVLEQLAAVEREQYMAIVSGVAGAVSAVLSIFNGLAAAIIALGVAATAGFGELIMANTRSHRGWDLIPQPFALRTAPIESSCTWNPDAPGGPARLSRFLTPRSEGGTGFLYRTGLGENVPDVPEAWAQAERNIEDGWMNGLILMPRDQRPPVNWTPWLVTAGAIVGGAALYKYWK